ncbi:alkyl sulfatase dimerization domain-containing protein [Enemella sp. A6]|uniref:alkyl sulfatase dimerization domain-containing protein n=1 Tax=Enemella sp. A6 TaxID=3440152 RepID=UPI003EBDA476
MITEADIRAAIDARTKELLTPEYLDEPIEVSEGLYMSPGNTAAYLLATDNGRVIINTGLGYEAPFHKHVFDKISDAPTRYIITTQGHTDHVGGVATFREPGTRYVAHENNPAAQDDDKRVFGRMRQWAPTWFTPSAEHMKKLSATYGDEPPVQDRPTPDVMFRDTMTLRVGGVEMELHHGVGETTDGAMVWFPQRRLLVVSNLLGPLFGHFPNINTIRGQKHRFVLPYLETIRRIRDLRPETVLTGRGEPIHGEELIDAVYRRQYEAVSHIHQATLDGINAGKDVETLMREVTLPEELYVGQGYGRVSWGVKTIFESYLGWFHQRSTTSLYPIEPEATQAALVELAGAEQVLTKAAAEFDAGRAEQATALAEAVLAADPDHAGARELLLKTHRALLEDPITADNFWHSGWLKYRIGQLEAEEA